MASDIKGLGTPPGSDQAALRTSKDNTPATAARPAAQPPASPAARAATDSVNLSSHAQSLKALEEKIQKLPEVNEKRVAEIKAALASGNYSVDDVVVADKLLNFDELFRQ
jgi:negative regulator of flagellin synthesis FlgM